jgi:hypothetical protein
MYMAWKPVLNGTGIYPTLRLLRSYSVVPFMLRLFEPKFTE